MHVHIGTQRPVALARQAIHEGIVQRLSTEEAAVGLADADIALRHAAKIGIRKRRRRIQEQAAKAALDGALHDLCGKLTGLPVWRLLGLPREGPPTSWTVWLGDPDDMARRAERVAGRFRRLKLKLGGRDGLDVERVRAVRGVSDVPLQVDVNEYWSLEEAFDALPQLAALGVEYCEQPLSAGNSMGGPELKRGSCQKASVHRAGCCRDCRRGTAPSRAPCA